VGSADTRAMSFLKLSSRESKLCCDTDILLSGGGGVPGGGGGGSLVSLRLP
jgi:hypothetical protein